MGRSLWGGLLALVAWGCGAAAGLAWALSGADAGRTGLAAGVLLATGGWAAVAWLRQRPGRLAWDGAAWHWQPAGSAARAGSVHAALDLQAALLLRWVGEGAGAWIWAERRHAPPAWDDLRRAVYSRAVSDAAPGHEPPSAAP